MKLRYHTVLIVALVLAPAVMRADDWPAPQTRNVFSSDGSRLRAHRPWLELGRGGGLRGRRDGRACARPVLCASGRSVLPACGRRGAHEPGGAGRCAGHQAGELVTFDNWHNFGFGAVIAIYGSEGALRVSYALEELYGEERLPKVPRSVSSRWWRCRPTGFVDPGSETRIYVRDVLGGEFVLELSPPSFTYHPGAAECSPPAGPLSSTWLGE